MRYKMPEPLAQGLAAAAWEIVAGAEAPVPRVAAVAACSTAYGGVGGQYVASARETYH